MAARLSNKAKPKTTPTPGPGHNSMHGEEAERVQLISIVSKLSQADDAVEVARLPLKAAQKARSQIIGLGKAAGFTAKELEKRLDEMRMTTREVAEMEHREHKHRRWLGSVTDDQKALQLGDAAPQETKDEHHWLGEGLKAGRRQLIAKAPPECPERFVQGWLGEHARGLKEVLEANVPGGKRIREQAAADFKEDNPEVDVDKAARRLKNDPEFMARGAPEAETHDGMGAPLDGGPADGFEATQEELDAQSTRQAVVAANEAAQADVV